MAVLRTLSLAILAGALACSPSSATRDEAVSPAMNVVLAPAMNVMLEKGIWEPLQPATITRDGDAILLTFRVAAPPLAFDTTLVPTASSLGFAFSDATDSPPTITSVILDGDDAVRIRLSHLPGPGGRLSYADPETGGGNLRDSDEARTGRGHPLYNWCVPFDVVVD
jgi:hypothetical protein